MAASGLTSVKIDRQNPKPTQAAKLRKDTPVMPAGCRLGPARLRILTGRGASRMRLGGARSAQKNLSTMTAGGFIKGCSGLGKRRKVMKNIEFFDVNSKGAILHRRNDRLCNVSCHLILNHRFFPDPQKSSTFYPHETHVHFTLRRPSRPEGLQK